MFFVFFYWLKTLDMKNIIFDFLIVHFYDDFPILSQNDRNIYLLSSLGFSVVVVVVLVNVCLFVCFPENISPHLLSSIDHVHQR